MLGSVDSKAYTHTVFIEPQVSVGYWRNSSDAPWPAACALHLQSHALWPILYMHARMYSHVSSTRDGDLGLRMGLL